MKQATTLEEQISLLKSRGVKIEDEEKAKECLLDIGYYRLCSYFFPFEKNYPSLKNRDHVVMSGTAFSNAVALYYFDFDLRIILIRYLTRIEVSIRTYMTYTISNKYPASPTWFVDPYVVNPSYASSFSTVYDAIRKKPAIKRHHQKYINDKYAPAWKTIEYMTFGSVEALYQNLRNICDKLEISKYYSVNQTSVFENYLEVIRYLRNTCAHGGVLIDLKLPLGIKNGPAGKMKDAERHNLSGSIKVVEFLLGVISSNRLADMREEIKKSCNDLLNIDNTLIDVIKKTSGLL